MITVQRAIFGLVILPLILCAGCAKEETILECVHGIDPVTKLCNSAPAGGETGNETGGQTTGNDGFGEDCPFGKDRFTGECQPEPPDAGGGGTDDVVASEDPGAADVKKDGQCDPFQDPMNLKMGNPCVGHCQCETGYCYDEAYMEPFRFCTKDCSSGPNSSCDSSSGDFPKYACLKFTAKQVNDYDLDFGGICAARCQNVEECAIYGPDYNHCPDFGTMWEGSTVQAANTCQVQ